MFDFSSIRPELPSFLKNESDSQFILCVGQHRKNKNLDLLIKAYDALKDSQNLTKKTTLIIVGSFGPETEKLKKLVEDLCLERLVFFPSSISDSELCWLYQHCVIFVIPSSFEGFCIPLVEALYFSCKVLCSNISIFREIGAESCTYFDLNKEAIKNLKVSAFEVLTAEKQIFPESLTRFTKAEAGSKSIKLYLSLT